MGGAEDGALESKASETVAAGGVWMCAVECTVADVVGDRECPVRPLSRTDLGRGFARMLWSAMGYAMRLGRGRVGGRRWAVWRE